MNGKRRTLIFGVVAVIALALACGQAAMNDEAQASEGQSVEAPMFEVDPFWPKPLPDHWVLGSAIGVGVDSRDHVFIVHRQASIAERTEGGADADPPIGECCRAAPPVLEFDPDGNLVNAWGPARTTASPSTTWTTCGSAGTGRTTRTS